MAGAGYKLFQTGDVLTAAQVNTYLNEQTVMVFASSAARTSALSGVLAEGMVSYLQDTNAVEVYNGSSWVNVGNAGDITEVQAGVGISIASGTGPIPVITNSSTDLITTAGDILYGTAADTVARLGIGAAGRVLKVNSGATAPEWAVDPTTDVVTTAGDLIYGTAADTVTRLGIGTAGQVLKVNSGATAPEWGAAAAGGGMTSLATGTLSSSTVNITSISGSYKNLQLVIRNFDPSTDSAGMYLRFNGDSGANRHYTIPTSEAGTTNQSFTATSVDLNAGTDNAVTTGLIVIDFPDYANATTWKFCNAYVLGVNTTTTTNFNWKALSGFYNQTGAITSITLLPSTGNFAGGDYILYGVN